MKNTFYAVFILALLMLSCNNLSRQGNLDKDSLNNAGIQSANMMRLYDSTVVIQPGMEELNQVNLFTLVDKSKAIQYINDILHSTLEKIACDKAVYTITGQLPVPDENCKAYVLKEELNTESMSWLAYYIVLISGNKIQSGLPVAYDLSTDKEKNILTSEMNGTFFSSEITQYQFSQASSPNHDELKKANTRKDMYEINPKDCFVGKMNLDYSD